MWCRIIVTTCLDLMSQMQEDANDSHVVGMPLVSGIVGDPAIEDRIYFSVSSTHSELVGAIREAGYSR